MLLRKRKKKKRKTRKVVGLEMLKAIVRDNYFLERFFFAKNYIPFLRLLIFGINIKKKKIIGSKEII